MNKLYKIFNPCDDTWGTYIWDGEASALSDVFINIETKIKLTLDYGAYGQLHDVGYIIPLWDILKPTKYLKPHKISNNFYLT
jgi:hypothetical protein